MTFYYYFLAFLKHLFGRPNCNSAFEAAVKTNFEHQTFRFQDRAKKDWLISIRIIVSIIKNQGKKYRSSVFDTASTIAIFDDDKTNAELRKNYVEFLDGRSTKLFIARKDLQKRQNLLFSAFLVLTLLLLLPFAFLFSVFSKNKLQAPLLILSAVEASHLSAILQKEKINYLHFFNIYENDANLLAFFIMKKNIFINKIPSEVPLAFWNKIIVADCLSFCFAYQQDEFDFYKAGMFVSSTQHWIPENSLSLLPIYAGKTFQTPKNMIGFYSSAMWLRKELGNVDLNHNAYENELHLLGFLVNYIKEFSDKKLKIFLHPLEKKHLSRSLNYYRSVFSELIIEDAGLQNDQHFFNADVAVTLYSTLAYERLFWGYKTLIFPLGYSDFPLTSSSFNTICAKGDKDLKTKLQKALDITTDGFFSNNGLSAYTYNNYKVLSIAG